LADSLASFPHQQSVGNFESPQRRHRRFPRPKPFKDRFGVRVVFILETPAHSHGAIHDETAQYFLPSSIISRMVSLPNLWPRRNFFISSITLWMSTFRLFSTGTSIAIGTPCLVIV